MRFERKQHGVYERRFGQIQHLLCRECESKFCTLEDYAKRFIYGSSKPIRIQLPLTQAIFEADYSKMRLFQLSLLWRACVADGPFFAGVSVNAHQLERLRQMLLTSDPGKSEECFCVMFRLVVTGVVLELMRKHGVGVETGSFAPVCTNMGRWSAVTLMMGGITWAFFVGDGVPSSLKEHFIQENGQFGFPQMDGDSFYIDYATKAVLAGNVTQADAEASAKARIPKKDVG